MNDMVSFFFLQPFKNILVCAADDDDDGMSPSGVLILFFMLERFGIYPHKLYTQQQKMLLSMCAVLVLIKSYHIYIYIYISGRIFNFLMEEWVIIEPNLIFSWVGSSRRGSVA